MIYVCNSDKDSGLANQWQGYLVALMVAENLGTELIILKNVNNKELNSYNSLDRSYKLDKFNIKYKEIIEKEKGLELYKDKIKFSYRGIGGSNSTDIEIKEMESYEDLMSIENDTLIEGFGDYYYKNDFIARVRSNYLSYFELKEELPNDLKEVLEDIKRTNSVSVHIRRGDLFTFYSDSRVSMNIIYLKEAFKLMSSFIDMPKFFIFSDDISWVNKIFPIFFGGYNYKIIDYNYPDQNVYDFHLMRHCKNNILNRYSTFSYMSCFLGVELNEKIIINLGHLADKNDMRTVDIIKEIKEVDENTKYIKYTIGNTYLSKIDQEQGILDIEKNILNEGDASYSIFKINNKYLSDIDLNIMVNGSYLKEILNLKEINENKEKEIEEIKIKYKNNKWVRFGRMSFLGKIRFLVKQLLKKIFNI